jgi:DNA-binding response OmpR family regulator
MPHYPIHVLVVEDDATFSNVVACELRAASYIPTVATTFYDALDIVDAPAKRIDVLLADINLDRGNGVALCRMARLRRPRLRTVYFTGHDVPGDLIGADILKKPFSRDAMCSVIQDALSDEPRSGLAQ